MKQILIAILAVLVLASIGMAQTNGTIAGGTQGTESGMKGGPHDFTSTAVNTLNNGTALKGPTDFLCGYCHVPHTSSAQVANVPLWGRKSLTTGTTHAASTFGRYTSNTMNSVTVDPKTTDDGNYSALCLSCHDGSAAFASAAYQSKPVPYGAAWPGAANVGFDTVKLPAFMNMSTTGSYGGLSHIHPVNMQYPTSDPGLFAAASVNYAYLDGDLQVGRLFGSTGSGVNGKVQCSSCHNPHIKESYSTGDQYPLIQGTLAGGKLCIACHKK
jgi:nitrate/TMAO reductase-like tetraheme cytochrome c subunit